MDEDIKLVEEILDGNIDSFNILVNKYELSILKFIYNIIKDREASEDITQEVFITVYNKLYTYNDKYKFSNWIFQIAKNKCIDYIRKYRRVYEANIEDAKDLVTNYMSPEECAEFNETKRFIEQYVNSLEETDKCILALRYSRDRMTFLDISEVLNISESAVKRRYYKIREKYKSLLNNSEKRCRG